MFSADLGGYTAPLPAATDPPFQKVALLLHGDGTNGAQNNTFVDSSTNNFTITRTGNVAQGTFSPFSLPEGQWSCYLDGTGDNFAAPSSTAFGFGSGDFTVEFWIFVNNSNWLAESRLQFFGPTSGNLNVTVKGGIGVVNEGVAHIIQNTGVYPDVGKWTHVAFTRSGSTLRLFKNGVQFASATSSVGVSSAPCTFQIAQVSGYFSNCRVVKGTALYTSNFTPSTTPLTAVSGTSLLTCQSNSFKDNSSNNFTITRNGDTKVTAFSPLAPSAAYSASTNGGSAYFDGSGDYLSLTTSANLDISTGDFTIEFYVNPSSVTAGVVFGLTDGAHISNAIQLTAMAYFSGSTLVFRVYSGTTIYTVASPAATANQWTHYALVRSGNVFTVYANGASAGTTTQAITLNYSGTWKWGIGSLIGDTQAGYINGYISNLRVIKGTALYTTTFTPPTAPLTAVTNTQLLLNCTNAGIIDNAGKNDIETVGNAQVSTSVKKYGTGSMYFDGAGDWLNIPSNDAFQFGTGDFTIEFWINFSSLPTSAAAANIYEGRRGAPGTASVAIALLNNGGVGQWLFIIQSTQWTYNFTPTLGQWYHIAATRSGTATKLFIDGSAVISVTNSTDISSTNGPYISNWNGSIGFLNGYIDDLRITKGQALYTANFTPPTQAFPNV